MNEYKMGTKEAIALMVNLLCNKFFVLAPLYMKNSAGNTLLIVTTLFFVIAFIVWQIYASMLNSNHELLDLITNNTIKTAVGSIIIIVITAVTILTLRQYAEGIKIMTLQKSPIFFIISIFTIAMIIGAICGLKSISKTCNFFVPIIYFLAVILVALTVKKENIYNFFPILGDGLPSIFGKSVILLSMLFEFIILLFLPPLLKEQNDFKKIGNHTLLWSFVCFAAIGGIYSISSTEHLSQTYEPFFRLIKQIEIGNSLRRCDSIFLIMYCISAFLYLSTMLIFIVRIASKVFKIKYSNTLIVPIGLIIASVAAMNIFEEYLFKIVENTNYLLWIIAFALPLVIISVKRLRLDK